MKKQIMLIMGFALLLSPALIAGDQAEWLTDYEQAVALSKKTGKPIMANFTGSDWCGYCKRLKKSVFSTAEFKEWAEESVVLLELDFPKYKNQERKIVLQNRQLASKYGIRGYPTILVLSENGKPMGKLGYSPGGADTWLNQAQKILESGRGTGP